MRSRKLFFYLAVLLLIGGILAFTHIGRYIFWNFADIGDLNKFPSVRIATGQNKFHFPGKPGNFRFDVPQISNETGTFDSFESFLEENKTVGFLMIKDDTIIYENYFGGYDTASLLPGFSIAKSMVSALVGVAIGEGAIKNIHQPVTDFLSGWKHQGFEEITIEHLLNMRSGIKFSENYFNPFSEVALFYYGKNLRKYTFNSRIAEPPGQRYDYISVNAQIVAYLLEEATGSSFPEYFEEKIWKKIGAEYDATWNLDSRKHGSVKAFCCMNATLRDFAKFGRLYLHGGSINGMQIIPEAYIERSSTIINDSRDSQNYPYTYFWRVLPSGQIFAKGILGQYIFIDPEKNIIGVRSGTGYADIDWINVFLDLGSQIQPD